MQATKRRIARADGSNYVLSSSLLPGQGNESQSHLYLNLSIINGDTGDQKSSTPQQCVFSEVRSVPIIQDASEYDLSVIRFTSNGTGRLLPLFIPVIQSNQIVPIDVDLTIYSLTVSLDPVTVAPGTQVYIKYVTSNLDSPKPTGVRPQDLSSDYYYVRTYTAWCNMFNTALRAAVATEIPGVVLADNQGLSYNSGTRLFSLLLPDVFYPPTASPGALPQAYLSFNAPLANLLANFNFTIQANPIVAGRAYTLNAPAITSFASGVPKIITQDFQSTDDIWSPIESFVFTTTFVPLLPEQGSAPVVVGSDNTGQNLGVGSGFTNVITDFTPDLTMGAQEGINSQVYIPSGEYRISSMTTHQPIQQVDISLFWRYRLTGQLIPVFMSNLSNVTMKIMFRRKDWGGKA